MKNISNFEVTDTGKYIHFERNLIKGSIKHTNYDILVPPLNLNKLNSKNVLIKFDINCANNIPSRGVIILKNKEKKLIYLKKDFFFLTIERYQFL